MKKIQFSTTTVVAVYAILAAGLLGIWWIWWQMPKDAVSIVIYDDRDGPPVKSFVITEDHDQATLKYKLDGQTIRIFFNKRIYIYALSSIGHVEIQKVEK